MAAGVFQFTNKIKECDQLKRELDSFRPLAPEILRQLKEYYKIGLTYACLKVESFIKLIKY